MTAVQLGPRLLDAAQRARLGRRAQPLAGASVTYNAVEAAVALGAGLVAGSVALVGFGLDSVVEVSSGLVVLWQFRHAVPEARERRALRLIAASFLALAAYVTVESVRALVTGADPEASPVSIALAIASLVVMPVLSRAQRHTGAAWGRPRWWPTAPRRCCAATSRRSCSSAWSWTPPWGGPGPTPSPGW